MANNEYAVRGVIAAVLQGTLANVLSDVSVPLDYEVSRHNPSLIMISRIILAGDGAGW